MERLAGHGFAALFQRAWEFLDIGFSDVAEKTVPAKAYIGAYPNPFNSICKIEIFADSGNPAPLRIVDICGKTVFEYPLHGGKKEILWQPGNCATGIYVAQFGEMQKKLLYMK